MSFRRNIKRNLKVLALLILSNLLFLAIKKTNYEKEYRSRILSQIYSSKKNSVLKQSLLTNINLKFYKNI